MRCVILFAILLVFVPAVTAAQTRNWYDGGTLHRANMHQWMSAPYPNRLATAADFAARMGQGRESDAAMRRAAIILLTCMDRAYIPQIDREPAARIAALCEVDLGWRR
jgi:hypothetical protein